MFDALYNNESKLDQIMAEGFKRIDDAVDEVIDRLAPDSTFGGAAGQRYWKVQRERNHQASRVAELMAVAAPKIWPTERDLIIDGLAGVKVDSDGGITRLRKKDIYL